MQLDPVSTVTSSAFRMIFPLREAFAHPAWDRALRRVEELARHGDRVVLIGEPGTGKTLLLQELDQSLRRQNLSVRNLRPSDVLHLLAPTDVLLIDEADLLAGHELERICLLPNAFIMAGLPGLLERLPASCRLVHRERLDKLRPEDIARFVRSRLAAAGPGHPSFTPEAVLAVMRHSAGLFRLVTILAGASSFFARQRGAAEVTASDVDEAAALRASAFEDGEIEEPTARPPASVEAVRAEPEWQVAGASRWQRHRRTVAGWTGWAGASLAVVLVAVLAARSTRSPHEALQAAGVRPIPALLSAALPDAPLAPPVPIASRSPPPVVAPPLPAVAGRPPAEPAARPEPVKAVADAPALHGVEPEPPVLAAAEPEQAPSVLVFGGQIVNDTMGQGGQLSLKLMTSSREGPIGALFHASHGLIGTGMLNGAIGPSGRVSLNGRLMMGRNPFDCTLDATIEGDRLVGQATFVRQATGSVAHSRFSLSRL